MKSLANPDVVDELVRRLEMLTPSMPRRWGIMAPNAMLCHLADAADSVLARPGGVAPEARRWRKWLGGYRHTGHHLRQFGL